jgi:branched-chain amino acid transport system ATP-binding protein
MASIETPEAQLVVDGIDAFYGGSIEALHDVSLHVARGEIVALLGANGAGKTTTMRAVANLLPAQRGRVRRGTIRFEGRDVLRTSPGDLVRLGLVSVLEGRHCFKSMTVEENLVAGAIARGSGRIATRLDLEHVYTLFPGLTAKRSLKAGQVSGGEQQMTAIGRALMARPKLLLLDEPSMGLAPLTAKFVFDALAHQNAAHGLSVLVAEQNVTLARAYASRFVMIRSGTSRETTGNEGAHLEAMHIG